MTSESVRLVIWDLDNTFWRGAVTEGGITFDERSCEIVKELARRGIVSSICSKNDLESVSRILKEHEIWDWFILPSINWKPKGPRLKALIEAVALRSATVLYIDDNPSALEEARRFIPDIQVAHETFMPRMLASPRLRGCDDPSLTRWKQYKRLEQRKRAQDHAGGDIHDFLRDSDITVVLEYDVDPHIERIVELINRTNHLNFTKQRLPDDPAAALAAAREQLRSYASQAALVHVRDRYGDHGYCGFYLHNSQARKLVHFCFSCRILGMGVERWIYQKLNCPAIDVCGDVLTNLHDDSVTVDWINRGERTQSIVDTASMPWEHITGRGGCELGAVLHYFTAAAADTRGEYHTCRDGGTFRIDHSVFLRHALDGLSHEALDVAHELGYIDDDFKTTLFDRRTGRQMILMSFNADGMEALYRHRRTGLVVPFSIPHTNPRLDARLIALKDLLAVAPGGTRWMPSALRLLKGEFDFLGRVSEADFKSNLAMILERLPESADVFVLQALDRPYQRNDVTCLIEPNFLRLNDWLHDTVKSFPRVRLLSIADYVERDSEIVDPLHFDRKVYFRIYQSLRDGPCTSRLG